MSKKPKVIAEQRSKKKQMSQLKFRGRGLKIKVAGVGGAGCAVISRMMKLRILHTEFIAINTDAQSLSSVSAHKKIRIGRAMTRGLGAGMDPVLGQQAAESSRKEIIEILRGADLIFLVAGLGGGTGSGALPVIADIVRELGILNIALVTRPFIFEGSSRMQLAEQSLKMLAPKVDTLISIANERILQVIDRKTPLLEAFSVVDDVLKQAIQGITEIVNFSGLVNVDLADLKTVLKEAGPALLSIGQAEGEDRVLMAVKMAIENPLLDLSIKGATGIIFIVTGGSDLAMYEVNEAAKYITELADPNCRIIFGVVLDESMSARGLRLRGSDSRSGSAAGGSEKVKITIIATGFNKNLNASEGLSPATLIKPEHAFESIAPSGIKINQVRSASEPSRSEPPTKKEIITPTKRVSKSEKFFSEDELEVPAFLRKKK